MSHKSLKVRFETELGVIDVELFTDKAPLSCQSFIQFLEDGRFKDGGFNRVVRPDNDAGNPKISVIQGGVLEANSIGKENCVPHETTEQSGIKHTDGTLSLARLQPGTGSGGVFFICLGEQPGLDFGAERYKDRQGFAAFGRVVQGMNVVKEIHQIRDVFETTDHYPDGQILKSPVRILEAHLL